MTPGTLDTVRDDLVRDEGERLKPYTDTRGKFTIGVGRDLTDVGITRAESRLLLEHDLASHLADLERTLPYWLRLDETRQRVLLEMCFNLGLAGVLGFRQMLTAVQGGQHAVAAAAMRDSRWADQVGARAERLAVLMESA